MYDLTLRNDICEKFDIPIKLVLGKIRKLYLNVPWNQLSSRPVTLEIDGLQLVISPLEKENWFDLIQRQNSLDILES